MYAYECQECRYGIPIAPSFPPIKPSLTFLFKVAMYKVAVLSVLSRK